MLILTRRVGERLYIGDDIQITVVAVNGNQVRMGINAPRDIAVHREEIYEKIRAEKAAGAPGPVRESDGPEHIDARSQG